jgi:hypothetical protein
MEGQVHFMRRVSLTGTVKVCNIEWQVPQPENTSTVWVTLEFAVTGAVLDIYDAAPDAEQRLCLASYDFALKEPVLPRQQADLVAASPSNNDDLTTVGQSDTVSMTETSASTPSPFTDDVPTSEVQVSAPVALSLPMATKTVDDPLVQPLPLPSLPVLLLLSLVRSAARWVRHTRFTIL